MKKRALPLLLCAALLLSGCGSFLNREYSVTAPHSATYYESEDPSVLRAESHQDLVNDLLLLIANRAMEGTVWLYPGRDIPDGAQAAERACREVQRETALGAYAVDYLTYTIEEEARSHSVMRLTLGYRRSAEQVAGMIHATSVSALHDLLTAAVKSGQEELVVQVTHFDRQRQEVLDMVEQVWRETTKPSAQREEEKEEREETEDGEDAQGPDGAGGQEDAQADEGDEGGEGGQAGENGEAAEGPEAPQGGEGETAGEGGDSDETVADREEPGGEKEEDAGGKALPWQVNFYPESGPAGIIEIILAEPKAEPSGRGRAPEGTPTEAATEGLTETATEEPLTEEPK